MSENQAINKLHILQRIENMGISEGGIHGRLNVGGKGDLAEKKKRGEINWWGGVEDKHMRRHQERKEWGRLEELRKF